MLGAYDTGMVRVWSIQSYSLASLKALLKKYLHTKAAALAAAGGTEGELALAVGLDGTRLDGEALRENRRRSTQARRHKHRKESTSSTGGGGGEVAVFGVAGSGMVELDGGSSLEDPFSLTLPSDGTETGGTKDAGGAAPTVPLGFGGMAISPLSLLNEWSAHSSPLLSGLAVCMTLLSFVCKWCLACS
jgi:hypothetical protein